MRKKARLDYASDIAGAREEGKIEMVKE